MESNLINETSSVCPVCLEAIPAQLLEKNGQVVMRKTCPEHGLFSAHIWHDANLYRTWGVNSLHANKMGEEFHREGLCPHKCGLCEEHEGDSCIAIVNVTNRCNLACPICFADSGHFNGSDLPLSDIDAMFAAVIQKKVNPVVQISGGEPTLRDDLPRIIRRAKAWGIHQLFVNSNGLRVSRNPGYALELKQAGLDALYLQFDGTDDDVYRTLRGKNMFDDKIAAVAACEEARLGVVLVPTVVGGINGEHLWDIVEFAKSHMPTVRGVHFQPYTGSGRAANSVKRLAVSERFPDGRLDLGDVVQELERQSKGEFSLSAVVPRHKFDSHCSFSATFLKGERGILRATSTRNSKPRKDPKSFTYDLFAHETVKSINCFWRRDLPIKNNACSCDYDAAHPSENTPFFAEALHDAMLTISGMHFQDADDADLGRFKGCCVHVTTPDGRSIPFCSAYLTSRSGEHLYPEVG